MYSVVIRSLKQFLFPSFCASCKTFDLSSSEIVCEECVLTIRPIVSHQLQITKTKSITVHAVGAYDQPLVSLILAKSSGKRTIAHQLGKLVWQKSSVRNVRFDYIVPIPLHWTRFAWRGYNQADEIARVIAHNSEKPMHHLLSRIRRTPFQSYFEGEARIQNVADVFALKSGDRDQYKNKRLLIVDDVMTSGATLRYAAKELFKLKPASISVVVVCRVA